MNRIGNMLEREEIGGFVKNHRPTGPPRERPWKHKTPRPERQKVKEVADEEVEERLTILLEQTRSQAPAVVLPTVPAASPLRRIEIHDKEVKMNNNGNGNAQSQIPWKEQLRKLEPRCPACIGDHAKILGKKVEGLCDDCGQTFIDETGNALAQGKLITLRDWLENRLAALEQKLKYAKAALEDAQTGSVKEAAAFVEKTIGSAQVLPEVRKRAFQQKKSELWLEKRGDTKYAIMKKLEDRVVSLEIVIDKTPPNANKPTEPAPAPTALLVVESAPVAPVLITAS